MFTKRIIPCLDVKNGRVVKGVNFVDLRDAGDPVEIGAAYDKEGADELVFLDITASSDARRTVVDMVRRVAETVFIPFTVGGGIRTVEDFREILRAGADKVSVNSAAILNPDLIAEAKKLSIDISALRYNIMLLKIWSDKHDIGEYERVRNRGDRVGKVKLSTNYYNVKFKYILAPMYLATYTYGGKTYSVAINGQSGETYCDAPSYLWKLILFIALGVITAPVVMGMIQLIVNSIFSLFS